MAAFGESASRMERTNASLTAEVDSLWVNIRQLQNKVRTLEKMMDTRATPLWGRLIFRLDGWPSWSTVADKPQWRPWRKWFTS